MFKQVKELYASLGVNVEQALEAMGNTPISRIAGRVMM